MAYDKTLGPLCGSSQQTEIDQGTRIPLASPVPRGGDKAGDKQKVLGPCELVLTRKTVSKKSTMGELSHRGCRLFYTMEHLEREIKIDKKTAVPPGKYEVKLMHSPKFGRVLPRLQNVPNFTGVLIHNGSYVENSEGCILVGNTKSADFLGGSVNAVNALLKFLQPYASASAKIWIRIQHGKGMQALDK